MTAALYKDPRYLAALQDVAENQERWAQYDLAKAVTLGLVEVNDKLRETAKKAGGFADYVVNGNLDSLLEDVRHTVAHLQAYGAYYTEFEPFTDRLFLWPITQQVSAAYLGGYYQRIYTANSHAVSWAGFGTDYAALCLHARPDGLKFLVYSFADEPMAGEMTVWGLEHANYTVRQGLDEDRDDVLDAETSQMMKMQLHRGVTIPVWLEPRKVTVIEVTQMNTLPDIRERADLALSAREIVRRDGGVEGIVHNIGSQEAPAVVALVNPYAETVQTLDFGTLAAPLDLYPKRITFRFEGVPNEKGWAVVLDAGNAVLEIYEGNNRIELPTE